jgi:hypothetical protein
LDNHERRPIVEKVPHPKLLVKAMELLSSVGAQVDIPIASLLEELGEEGVISHLLNNKATVRWAPTTIQYNTELPQPTLGVIM